MPRYAFIADATVTNIVDASPQFIAQATGLFDIAVDITARTDTPTIGWRWDDGQLLPPRVTFDPSAMSDLGGDSPAVNSTP